MHIPCGAITIALDNPRGDISFLSHAHSDHASGLKKQTRLIASEETIDLANFDQSRNTKPETGNWELLDAGHILGSRQLAIDADGERVVYTGDISLKPNIFGWKADLPSCDRLIVEATYGDPAYRFPSLDSVRDQISAWIKANDSKNIIIGCYELGKAQQVVRILNEGAIAPIVTEKTERFCSIYEKHGVKLDRIVIGSEEAEEAMSRPFVALVPMHRAKRYFAHRLAQAFERETLCIVATGWALHYRFDADAAFPLSDHADFDDLVYFVGQTGAKKVEFFCGDGTRVLEAVRAKNGALLGS